jgi:hypothetical protein
MKAKMQKQQVTKKREEKVQMENQKHTNRTTNMEIIIILKHQRVKNQEKVKDKVRNQQARNQKQQIQDLRRKLEHTVDMESRI